MNRLYLNTKLSLLETWKPAFEISSSLLYYLKFMCVCAIEMLFCISRNYLDIHKQNHQNHNFLKVYFLA